MRAGDLRERVTLQSRGATRVRGGQNLAFSDLATNEPAAVQATSALSRYEQERISAGVTHVVTVRRSDTTARLTTKDRILWDSRTLELVSPPTDEGGRREFLQCQCQEARS